MKTKTLMLILFATISCAAQTVSSKPTEPPVLSDLQKLQLLNASKDVELWKLRAQAAVAEHEKAAQALQRLIVAATPPGYQMTEKMELVKVPDKAAKK